MNPVDFIDGTRTRPKPRSSSEPEINDGRTAEEINQAFQGSNPSWSMTTGKVDPNSLRIDPRVQRDPDRIMINKIKRKPNGRAFGTITVSVRTNENGLEVDRVILDGQSRWTAVVEMGWDIMLNAIIHKNLTLAEEVELFKTLNDKRSVPAWEQFKVDLSGNEQLPKQIKQILDNLGIPLGGNTGFVAVTAARRIAEKPNGLIHLHWALETIQAVYGKPDGMRSLRKGRLHLWDGRIVEGFAMFHAVNGSRIKDDRLRKQLLEWEKGLSGLVGDAKTLMELRGGMLPINVADILVRRWNHGLKKNGPHVLPEFDRRPKPAKTAETAEASEE